MHYSNHQLDKNNNKCNRGVVSMIRVALIFVVSVNLDRNTLSIALRILQKKMLDCGYIFSNIDVNKPHPGPIFAIVICWNDSERCLNSSIAVGINRTLHSNCFKFKNYFFDPKT